MINTNELIFVNNILTTKLTIRKAAKQLGLRRDDLISRIKIMLNGDEENLSRLNLVILVNKMLFDNLSIKEVAKIMNLSEKELDKKIILILNNNQDKMKRYEEYKKKNLKGNVNEK